MSNDKQQVNPYPIRLTKELRERLEEAAKVSGRSLNAEMLLRLEASFVVMEDVKTLEPAQVLEVRRIVQEELIKSGK